MKHRAFVIRDGRRFFISTLNFPVHTSKFTEDIEQAQLFWDAEYVHEKMRGTTLQDMKLEKAVNNG